MYEDLTTVTYKIKNMAVIADVVLTKRAFELGRILSSGAEKSVELETVVPLGEQPVPFFRVFDESALFEPKVRDHPAVTDIHPVSTEDEGTLYALDWDVSTDTFFMGLMETDATILGAQSLQTNWEFSLRFPSHDALGDFETYCEDNDVPIEIQQLFNPTRPDAGPWYGLTPPQRESLRMAVERGYYAIPRMISTNELAAEFDVSDQAMTERLRRGIMGLVSNTLLVNEEAENP